MIRNPGEETAEQRSALECLLENEFSMNSPEEFVSVLAGICSQIVTTVVTRRVDSDGLGEHGRRAMSISLALFAKWSGQLTSLLERLGNYKTIVYHVADTLH